MTNPLLGIRALGQSIWYDNLSRELLRSGRLARMIQEDGVSGVTSNPTIFEKAIGQEKIYDNDIHLLVDTGLDVERVYEGLAVTDIREAADLLKPLYDETSGYDGYVSLEVSPHLARNSSGTVAQATRLFELVDRPNVMIKVPATPEGLIAVKELIASGINVNITLMFSLEQYRGAAEAYIQGVEQWTASGGDPKKSASVASFFVSRVDTMIDERLKEIADPRGKTEIKELMERAAIANARLAYSVYKEIFHGERFSQLKDRDVRTQRVLWASTSTKNPDYPDTYYVDALIGPETVNTVPTVTLDAFRSHGVPVSRLEQGLDKALMVFQRLEELEINVGEVMEQLLEDGVKAFADSYDKLLASIAKKRTRLLRGWGHRSASLGELQTRVDETLARLDKERFTESLWSGDASLWSDDPKARGEIGHRLGWLQCVETMRGETDRLKNFADEIRSEGFKHAVLLGMGGSSLAPAVFMSCFGSTDGHVQLHVLDTTVPKAILDLEAKLDLKRTLFIVASKSGGTIEVVSLYKYFWSRMQDLSGEEAGQHFVAVTDPGTTLGKLASEQRFRRTFLNPPDIGGRFSALSYFGLVPAALIGLDLDRLLMRAGQAAEASGPEVPCLESPAAWLGVIMAEACLAGKDKLTFVISPTLGSFGWWLEQLIAESTGKEGKGILPIDGEPLGAPDVYGKDRLFVYLRLDDEGSFDQEVSALEKAGHLVATQRMHGQYDLGREIFRWEFATAVAGAILKINAFDQPNVQEAKDITKEYLEAYKKVGRISLGDPLRIDDPNLATAFKEFLEPLTRGNYVAFNAFLSFSSENNAVLQQIRTRVRDRFQTATTVGFGPRYLHSTGQIHKGGPDTGCYIVVTADDTEDVTVPGEPYTFGVLKSAQSMGDLEALQKKGRRVLHIHLKTEADLPKLLEAANQL